MAEIKNKKLAEQIKKNPIAKQDFEACLKKACKQNMGPTRSIAGLGGAKPGAN